MLLRSRAYIPVVDIFAGPGGLGEGFCAYTDARGRRPFKIAVSVEKEDQAHKTLLLRSFYRQFEPGDAPVIFYRHIKGDLTFEEFISEIHDTPAGRQALYEARQHELGQDAAKDAELSREIAAKIGREDCVLIGGPPCQAYSLVGRSRNKGRDGYRLENDPKATLYLEYLQLIADLWPAVFVMENVKGLLSSRIDGQRVFDRIREDLADPAEAIRRDGRTRLHGRKRRYKICALTEVGLFRQLEPKDFVIRSEQFGIPQARHRVILVGIREDFDANRLIQLAPTKGPTVDEMIRDLPIVRSGLSKEIDSPEAWADAVLDLCSPRWQKRIYEANGEAVCERILKLKTCRTRMTKLGRGADYIVGSPCVQYERGWFVDPAIGGFCNHTTRSHIRSDLHRYAFAAAYVEAHNQQLSPCLSDFPRGLLPEHRNVAEAVDGSCFGDRFRVQAKSRPSTTITSHISKDGHYYIHYDPMQCRSLTVREAARLQTFPDNYYFEGKRTAQYIQVGNAVPPLLARQIANSVYQLLS
jgi:DNA (cytosine-5)-methyltransferase 1